MRGALLFVLVFVLLPACGADDAAVVTNGAWTAEQRTAATRLRVPIFREHGPTGLRFVLVPGWGDVAPFYVSSTEVTNAQYRAFDPEHRGTFHGERKPVDMVRYSDAVRFARWVGPGVRLPTEAEWEHACRAGTKTAYAFGDGITRADANIQGAGPVVPAANNRSREVGAYPANGWGLFDMHGNLWELCTIGGRTDRVAIRGGSWRHRPQDARSDARHAVGVDHCDPDTGFRLVWELEPRAPK